MGLFIECTQPTGQKFFEGECIPDPNNLKSLFTELNEDEYPHAWRGAIIAFVLGLGLMVRMSVCTWMREISSCSCLGHAQKGQQTYFI